MNCLSDPCHDFIAGIMKDVVILIHKSIKAIKGQRKILKQIANRFRESFQHNLHCKFFLFFF